MGCQHPACHPGSRLVLALWEAPALTGTDPSIPRDLLGHKEAQEEKKAPILPCPAAEPAKEATDDSLQMAQ